MLHVISDGERRHRLIDHQGREVGWIRGRAVRFLGFASESDVMDAARRAWRALDEILRHVVDGATARPALQSLKLVHDGAYEWIADGAVPIARLFRPNARDASFAIELLVPTYVPDHVAVSAMHAMADALRPHTSIARARMDSPDARTGGPPGAA
jgi:hypothetical protein